MDCAEVVGAVVVNIGVVITVMVGAAVVVIAFSCKIYPSLNVYSND